MKTESFHSTGERVAVIIILFASVILRLRQYLTGRSLWLDEAMLALNIVNRNFLDLFKPLDYDQGAPIGFLLIEKAFSLLFGRNELVLRLFPLTLGLLSLWVFYLLLKHFTRGTTLVIALGLFAFNPRLIYYSSEVKQYIADVFATLVLLLITVNHCEGPTRKQLGVLTVTGLLALWFSHPSLFLLAGIGLTLLIFHIQKRDFANLRLIVGLGVLWLANVGLLYSLTLRNLHGNSYMRAYWQDAFAPMPWSSLSWYWDAFRANADTLFGVTFIPWLLLIFLLAGWWLMLRQKKYFAIVIGLTLFFTLLASSLTLYPSLERMVLFLTPIWILLAVGFMDGISRPLRAKRTVSVAVIMLSAAYLFWGIVPSAFEEFISPKYHEHIRPTIQYLREAWQEGDTLYISYGATPAFVYYAPMYGLEDAAYISGQRDDYKNPPAMVARLEPLKGRKRVWVLISHVYEKGNFNEHDILFEYFKKNGVKKRVFVEPGTSVYLYLFDLSR